MIASSSPPPSSPRVLVVGGGIGGLAVAVGLRRAGLPVEVAEAAPALEPVGAGIVLWPNALHALDRLGLGAAVRAVSQPSAGGAIWTPDGRPLVRVDPEALAARLGEAPRAIHRADLQAVLADAFDGPLHLGARVIGIEDEGKRVRVRVADDREFEADVLIGADGLHSAVRSALHGAAAPAYAGYTAWRGVAQADGAVLDGEAVGRGQRFGQVPLPDGRVYWFATATVPAGGRDAARDELVRRFTEWHPSVRSLVEATPEGAVLRNDVSDRPPLGVWGRGRITLLGDAAHPSTPNLGQGAGLALEDAAVLADRLGSTRDGLAALRDYEAARSGRTAAVVRRSRRVGALMQASNPVAVAARTLLLRLTPPRAVLAQTARVGAYDAFRDEPPSLPVT
ncbi:FAD-dependent monooxygenase [Rubrivirga marina]|uniref:FAD-binding domain-containing protein n=1 Tax=Rubrivirga marina TaxID=1196024 RepID=A0A271IUW7_9BACT|nr:FAD-dependent monooxygenase [Rubrivirga marina]PAP75051.1 hypothetical protein BSZ37_00590 [Rubrivirga marina]